MRYLAYSNESRFSLGKMPDLPGKHLTVRTLTYDNEFLVSYPFVSERCTQQIDHSGLMKDTGLRHKLASKQVLKGGHVLQMVLQKTIV